MTEEVEFLRDAFIAETIQKRIAAGLPPVCDKGDPGIPENSRG